MACAWITHPDCRRHEMGADHPEAPEFQLGDGCLADQLIGQYLADMASLGPLLDPAKIRKADSTFIS